ncbi:MAG: capsule assembly Wzi family protein [Bacteroides sp.]|nr:capsule assembly Wzi family protein [Roseburia sp.]MCM1345485.1 capsule assembly Wzi family protein [Bacteroides sp.]MCM1419994.1 capsule assembly Wzi family protein [Bacteroides sp.]
MRKWICMVLVALSAENLPAQISRLGENLTFSAEMAGTMSNGEHAPFWLTANKYGLSSIENNSGYIRGGIFRNASADSLRNWQIGYGADFVIPANYTSHFVIQQLYTELRYKKGLLSVGAKERMMELKNNDLSSGSQTLGINARPIPQIRIELPEYWNIPLTGGWVQLKGHIAYGAMTDDKWQHEFTQKKSRYADNVFYHSKAGYLRIGNKDKSPFSLELGLEMATQFGGTTYQPNGDGAITATKNSSNLKAFWNAFIPNGSGDPYEQQYQFTNVEGNHLGSWVMRASYEKSKWKASVYADHFFEDHSSMFMLDYDGYGNGNDWNTRKKNKYLLYDFKDIMFGAELNLKQGRWIRDIVVEYLYTEYQSGPIYHDHNPNTPDHIGGNDNYYNHSIFPGWQHWGQVIGNPLYLSPVYNTDGTIQTKDNRFKAFHLGISGEPTGYWQYKILATWRQGLGTYNIPYTKHKEQTSILAEAAYKFHSKTLKGWSAGAAVGLDFGETTGDNQGVCVKITKKGFISK